MLKSKNVLRNYLLCFIRTSMHRMSKEANFKYTRSEIIGLTFILALVYYSSKILVSSFEEFIWYQSIISILIINCIRKFYTTPKLISDDLVVHRDSKDNNPDTPFQFTEANMARISALLQNYPKGAQRSVLGAALDIAQRQIGWVPISAMHKVAELLSVPRIRVYEYATFYTMYNRKFRGKFHVKICKTTPCMLRGSDYIVQAVEEATCCTVGNLSPDKMFGVDLVECQGACVNAPVIVVNDDFYEDLTLCDVYNIINMLKAGCIPPPGPQSGRFAAEPFCNQQTLLMCPPQPGYGLQDCLLKGSKKK